MKKENRKQVLDALYGFFLVVEKDEKLKGEYRQGVLDGIERVFKLFQSGSDSLIKSLQDKA